MNHKTAQKNLADYLEGDLGLEERALLDAHLDECESCAREVVEMQQTIRLLRLMPEPETPPMISADVMRRIRAGESRTSWFSRVSAAIGRIFEPSFVLPASAVAAAALVVVVVQDSGPAGIDTIAPSPTGAARVAALDRVATSLAPASRPSAASARTRQPMRIVTRGSAPTASGDSVSNVASATGSSGRAGNGSAGVRVFREPSLATPNDQMQAPREALEPTELLADLLAANRGARSLVAGGALESGALRAGSAFAARGGRGVLAPPPATLLRGRVSDARAAGRARTVSQSLPSPMLDLGSSAGADPRDAWLDRGLRDPVQFARFLGDKSLAEQELWVGRLAERAASRGVLEELVLMLQASGDDAAIWLASDFAAEAERVRATSDSRGDR